MTLTRITLFLIKPPYVTFEKLSPCIPFKDLSALRMSLAYREMSLLNYGTINLHTKIVQKYQLIAVSHSVLVDPVEVLVHPCVDTGKVWLRASRSPRDDPAQLPHLTNNVALY